MALYTWQHTAFGKTWQINFLGSGTADDLLVRQWPQVKFVNSPEEKEAGIFARQLKVPIHDRAGNRGYLTKRLLTENIEVEVSLDGSNIFYGNAFVEGIRYEILQDTYDASIVVSDGFQELKNKFTQIGKLNHDTFLRTILDGTGKNLPIRVFTDWEADGQFINFAYNVINQFRFTGLKNNDDSHFDALEKYCTTFGMQIFQWNGEWIVRQLSVLEGTTVNSYIIAPDGTLSTESFSLGNSVTLNGYEDSTIEYLEGYGLANTEFPLEHDQGTFGNATFEPGSGGNEFEIWSENGSGITSLPFSGFPVLDTNPGAQEDNVDSLDEKKRENLAVIQDATSSLNQESRQVVTVNNDLVTITSTAIIRDAYNTGSGDSRQGEEITVGWMKVIFVDGRDGTKYYLQNDGTVTTTESWLHNDTSVDGLVHGEILFNGDNDLYYIYKRNIELRLNQGTGFPSGFYGYTQLIINGNASIDGSGSVGFGDNKMLVYVAEASIGFSKSNVVYNRILANAQSGSLDNQKNLELAIHSNDQQYVEDQIEYWDGNRWKSATTFDSGISFLEKRARDFIKFNDKNLIRYNLEHDYDQINDILTLYDFDGSTYLLLLIDYTIGEADVEAVFIQHEPTTNTISSEKYYDFGEQSSDDGTATGGTSSSGGGGGSGMSEAEADNKYFKINDNLDEGDPATMRGNLGFNLTDGAILKGGANNSVLDSNLTESQINTHLNATDNPHDTSFGNILGSINDGQVPQSAVTQHEGAITIVSSQISDKGNSNGVASLDSGGKVPITQLPNSIMEYQGTWNADTNTPTLSDGSGNIGDVYRCTVAGTTDFGSGAISFEVGDYAIYNASGKWEKSDTTDAVATVFGRKGNVTAQSGDYSFSQISGTASTSQLPSTVILEGENISLLNNDANYATESYVDGEVTSWSLEDARGVDNVMVGNVEIDGGNLILGGGDNIITYNDAGTQGAIFFRDSVDHIYLGDFDGVFVNTRIRSGGSDAIVLDPNQNVDIRNGTFALQSGTSVNEIVTSISSPTDDQLATALGVKNFVEGKGYITDYTVTQSDVTQHEGAINHNALTNYVADEHIDWTSDQGTTDIHVNNLPSSVMLEGENVSLLNNDAGYLTSESDTLDDVLSRTGTASQNLQTSGDVVISGNFTIGSSLQITQIADDFSNVDQNTLATTQAITNYLNNIVFQTLKVTLSSSQIKSLSSNPPTLLNAPGTNKVLLVTHIYLYFHAGSTAYDQDEFLFASIHDNTTGLYESYFRINDEAIDGTSSSDRGGHMNNINSDMGGSVTLENSPLKLTSPADPINGDGTLDVYITYRTLDIS